MEFTSFQQAITQTRKLRVNSYGDCLRRGPKQILGSDRAEGAELIFEGDDHTIFKASSYARTPGPGVSALDKLLKNTLPDDLKSFYSTYAEALVVTRTYPIHIWSIDKITDWLMNMRQNKTPPTGSLGLEITSS